MTQMILVIAAFVALIAVAYWLAYRDDKATAQFRENLQVGNQVYYTFDRLPKQGRVVRVFHEYLYIKDSVDGEVYAVAKKHVYRLS